MISLINGVTLLFPGAWIALRWMCVGVFELSHISPNNLSQQIKCTFTTNIIKPGCMMVCGLTILFVIYRNE